MSYVCRESDICNLPIIRQKLKTIVPTLLLKNILMKIKCLIRLIRINQISWNIVFDRTLTLQNELNLTIPWPVMEEDNVTMS